MSPAASVAPPLASSSLELSPVWLQGQPQRAGDGGRPSTGTLPPLRPLTLWALFDHPVSSIELRIPGSAPSASWLGFRTTVARRADASTAQTSLRRGLRDAHLPRPEIDAPEACPPELPAHCLWLRPPVSRTPTSALDQLTPPFLQELLDSLNARGNRATLSISVRLDGAHGGLADALELLNQSDQLLRRSLRSPGFPGAREHRQLDRHRKLRALVGQMSRFPTELRLCTDAPVDPYELQWALEQMEERTVPERRWSHTAEVGSIDVFLLNRLMATVEEEAPREDIPF